MGAVRTVFQALGILAVVAIPAFAQKTDVVRLVNGDTLTCEIKLLDRGRLEVSTDHLGTVNIEWDKVASVTSTRLFRVETTDGLRLLGSLATPAIGQLDVIQEAEKVTTNALDVVFIAPIERRFWRQLDGAFNLGMSYTQSSGVAQLNFSANATHRRASSQLAASASSYLTGDDDGDDTSRHELDLGGVRYFRQRSLWLLQGGFMRNQELGYKLRSTISGGLGQFLVHSNRAIVVLGGGLSTSREVPVDGNSTQEFEALIGARQSYFTYDTPKTNISTNVALYPSLSQTGRVRIELNGQVNREIVKDFTVGFTIYDSFDNRPPSEGARKNDVGLSLTIGWTF
jgi:Protein of unknown function, DUF481